MLARESPAGEWSDAESSGEEESLDGESSGAGSSVEESPFESLSPLDSSWFSLSFLFLFFVLFLAVFLLLPVILPRAFAAFRPRQS